ncbi:MAG: hypothetical protein DRQ49_19325 [Gammaproteobacteria bacterium]|nr:MAG: hypothetical protein DRQ49_19325 [Gammaproteobacteria bacterium]
MLIKDINNKERTVYDDLKIIIDKRSNECGQIFHENVDGELQAMQEVSVVNVEEQFVEYTIIGRNREWIEWCPLKDFERLNPDILLSEGV